MTEESTFRKIRDKQKNYNIESFEDLKKTDSGHSNNLGAEDLTYQYYQGYSPYSYNIAGKPFITLFNSQGDTCSVASSYQRQFAVDNQCIESSARTSSGQLQFSLSVQCATTSPFSTWSAVIFDSTACGDSPITRVNGDGPCTCMPFDVGGESFDIKVNCGGIVLFPCNAYFDDAYYYGASSSISLYAKIFDNQQCSSSPVPMTTTIGQSNRTTVGTNGLNVQNGHCVTGTFDGNEGPTSLGFSLECKEPTTSSKWIVDVYQNCSDAAMKESPLAVLKGYNPCDCTSGETAGIAYSLSINCAGSTTYTCASSASQTSTSFVTADHLAGIVIGTIAIFALLMGILYPILATYVFSSRKVILDAADDEVVSPLSNPFTSSSSHDNSRESDVSIPRDSDLTIVTNPLSSTSRTVESMDLYSSFYEKENPYKQEYHKQTRHRTSSDKGDSSSQMNDHV